MWNGLFSAKSLNILVPAAPQGRLTQVQHNGTQRNPVLPSHKEFQLFSSLVMNVSHLHRGHHLKAAVLVLIS
jgi:hypothetical protein